MSAHCKVTTGKEVEISSKTEKDKRVLVLFLFGLSLLLFDLMPSHMDELRQKQVEQDKASALTVYAGAGEGWYPGEDFSARQAYFLNQPMPINRATREDLALLPGIGFRLADRIVSFRDHKGPLTTIEDLELIAGIGEKMSRKISSFVTFAQP
jgi:competence protein ComEA